MLTDREKAIKDVLIDELRKLGGLSYAEHRRVKDQIDGTFIQKQMARMKRTQRLYAGAACIAALLNIVLAVYPYLEAGKPLGSLQQIGPIGQILMSVVWIVMFLNLYGVMQNRRTIFKVLKILEE